MADRYAPTWSLSLLAALACGPRAPQREPRDPASVERDASAAAPAAATGSTCEPEGGATPDTPADRIAWEFFVACARPDLVRRVEAGERVLGFDAATLQPLLAPSISPSLRVDEPRPGRELRSMVDREIATISGGIVVGHRDRIRDGASYKIVHMYLGTPETAVDGGLVLKWVVGSEGVVIGYRIAGG